MAKELSIFNFGELSKPATVLIEKISNAVWGLFRPYQIIRVAKAEAEAERIGAESQIQITDLQRRAMHRFLEEEAKRQANIESITAKALADLRDDSSPGSVEDDWIANFFDKCRIISDDDMQKLWGQVLAGEANSPGSFSKKTINLLVDLDRHDAELFMSLCGFCWCISGDLIPLVGSHRDKVYNDRGIKFESLSHLESLGLVQFDGDGFVLEDLPENVVASYYGRHVNLMLPDFARHNFGVGCVLLTRAGQELGRICKTDQVAGFFDCMYERWAREGYVIEEDVKDTNGQ